jgi:GNAT superfamily N-acetyltransferase
MRYSDVVHLDGLSIPLRSKLRRLTVPGARMRERLAHPESILVVLALDELGPVGWATAGGDGFMDCYVAPEERRQGVGTGLVSRLVPEAQRAWPGVELRTEARRKSPGEFFWRSIREREAWKRTGKSEHARVLAEAECAAWRVD